jgi:UDP-glucose 4-epimerase
MEIIVTGGAGYIGSHLVNYLISQGDSVICIDNLSTGDPRFVNVKAKLMHGDIRDQSFLKKALRKIENPQGAGVIHLAGLKYASESVKDPISFYDVNVNGTTSLLRSMTEVGIPNFVFSSSCSVYGSSEASKKVGEGDPLDPISPYAKSKLFAESVIKDVSLSAGIQTVSLRYFNVAGNGSQLGLDRSPYNLFPNLYRALHANRPLTLYGNDFATFDGTCIRDYLDVNVLSRFHANLLKRMSSGEEFSSVYNLGSEKGYSVLEVIDIARTEINNTLKVNVLPRRVGDPAQILADCSAARADLGWEHSTPLATIVKDGWHAWQRYFH